MASALLEHPSSSRSRAVPFAAAMVAAIAIVWAVVTTLVMTLADTSTLGAIGVGGFAAFWMGGGFGAIFGSAAAFGKDH